MNIDYLKAQVSNYLDEKIGLDAYRLDVGIILDYLHARGLLMVWNYDMSEAPRDGTIFLARGEHPKNIAVVYYGIFGDLFINGTLKKWDEPSSQPTQWMPLPKGDA